MTNNKFTKIKKEQILKPALTPLKYKYMKI